VRRLDDPKRWKDVFDHVIDQKIAKSKVTCFSKTYSNTLMWSHYADHHKGFCLEFNGSMEPQAILDRGIATILCVNYDDTELITVNYNEAKDRGVVELFTRKSPDWRYEEEVRVIIMDDNGLQKFNKQFLTGIIVGCRTPDSDVEKMLKTIKEGHYSIKVQRAVKKKFKLDFETISL